MVNVEAEVSKHKNCRDRDELGRLIKEYKSLAIQFASNMVMAGQYNKVALKLQEICDRLPAPNLKYPTGNNLNIPVKTANITSEENARINTAWKKKTGGTHGH
jgi:hypothetical protein